MRRFVLMCTLWFFVSLYCKGQQSHQLTYTFSPSRLLKLGNRNLFSQPMSPSVHSFYYGWATNPASRWQRYWRQPQVGIHGFMIDLNDPEILGYAVGVMPSLSFKILGIKNIGLYGTFGSGLGYISKTYDKVTNPTNNAIGSHVNNLTHFDADIGMSLGRFGASVGYQLTHLSNARYAAPNTGFNLHGWQVKVTHHGLAKFQNRIPTFSKDTIRRFGVDFIVGYGVSEYTFTGGSKYGTFFSGLGLQYRWSKFLASTIGAEYEYNQSVFQFFNQDFDSDNVARKKATQTSIYLAQRLRFGYVAIRMQGGIYLPYPDIARDRHPNYLRIGIDIHPLNGRLGWDPYIGISLKSHKAVAQYLGMYCGVNI
jgi:hypothetical protein